MQFQALGACVWSGDGVAIPESTFTIMTRVLDKGAFFSTMVLQDLLREIHKKYGLAGARDVFFIRPSGCHFRSRTNVCMAAVHATQFLQANNGTADPLNRKDHGLGTIHQCFGCGQHAKSQVDAHFAFHQDCHQSDRNTATAAQVQWHAAVEASTMKANAQRKLYAKL